MFIPVSGAAGIWGPSCRACAELAASEINRKSGVQGKELVLSFQDSGGTPDTVAAVADRLVGIGSVDALVGMHTSDVRQALSKIVSGRIPFVYTPLYEGGNQSPGVYCIGETPAQQLLPALDWMHDRYRVRKWYLLGHDYIWPKMIHECAYRHLKGSSQEIVGTRLIPFAQHDYRQELEEIRQSKCDAVLVSLVGQGSVLFNRAFGQAGLSDHVLRLSCAVEENMLLGIGQDNTDGLFATGGYFSSVDSHRNQSFRERYHQYFDGESPPLNTMGQSVYEGVHFLTTLLSPSFSRHRTPPNPVPLKGGRQAVYQGSAVRLPSMYIAEAQGFNFQIRQRCTL
ncbi:MAG: substrate-binding domain-containing protein [Gammaproteobacteria bacterium]|nr:substrate-binding domain-containing protein [Gammaproteobacteria bacterium]